ncbi:diaminopimelate epimerase [Fructilactobacillus vespulae]|uniref:diaminopimelate epimerase n=1 Tax=Fructilactobacillus vespulae TaxID=1249630 RepID=UPI0039B5CB51
MTKLLKVHGSENTFFIFDISKMENKPSIEQLSQLTIAFKKSNNEILNDIDGILVVDSSKHADCLGKMTVINSDGSIASMCGNGLRTVTRYLADEFGKDTFKVETQKSDLHVERSKKLAQNVPAFGVEIGPVLFDKASFPFTNLDTDEIHDQVVPQLDDELKFTAIAVPNPHLISFVSDEVLNSDKLKNLGTYLNGDNPYFTDGVNINFATIIDQDVLFVKTFERGVGFTNACGTGMSSTSLAYALNTYKGDFDKVITVYNPGGMVKVKVKRTGDQFHLELIANATNIGTLTAPEAELLKHDFSNIAFEKTNEDADYLLWQPH